MPEPIRRIRSRRVDLSASGELGRQTRRGLTNVSNGTGAFAGTSMHSPANAWLSVGLRIMGPTNTAGARAGAQVTGDARYRPRGPRVRGGR